MRTVEARTLTGRETVGAGLLDYCFSGIGAEIIRRIYTVTR